MKIVFFGTPKYVVPILDKLHKEFRNKDGGIVAVVTQAPKPAGRKKELKYSAVDGWAHKHNIPKLHDSEKLLSKNIEADIGVLAAYGDIIPENVIDYFKFGILNVHPSNLPQFRGASPIQATLITQNKVAVSIIKMDKKLDHGEIITKFTDDIRVDDTTGILTERLFERSADVLSKLLPAYTAGKITSKPQDHKKATTTRTIKKDDAYVDPKILGFALKGETAQSGWEIPFVKSLELKPTPKILDRFIRAMQPWPQAWTQVEDQKRLKLLKAHVINKMLILDKVQLEGKNPVSWKQFCQAYPKYVFGD